MQFKNKIKTYSCINRVLFSYAFRQHLNVYKIRRKLMGLTTADLSCALLGMIRTKKGNSSPFRRLSHNQLFHCGGRISVLSGQTELAQVGELHKYIFYPPIWLWGRSFWWFRTFLMVPFTSPFSIKVICKLGFCNGPGYR